MMMKEIAQSKTKLGKELEVKDWGQLRYFLEIEIVNGAEGIVLSQRKCARLAHKDKHVRLQAYSFSN
jgi:hypothetical protein